MTALEQKAMTQTLNTMVTSPRSYHQDYKRCWRPTRRRSHICAFKKV